MPPSCVADRTASGIAVHSILEEPMVAALPAGSPLAVARARHPLPLGALAGEIFILYRRPLGPGLYDAIIAACQRAGYSPKIGQEAPRMLATLSLVAAGLGVTLVPQSMRRLRVHGVIYRPYRQRGRARRAAEPGLSPLRNLAGGAAVHGAGAGPTRPPEA